MKKIAFLLLTLSLSTSSFAQTKPKEVLLIGTFHFHNPGADVAQIKTFDVMAPKVQAELESIADKIGLFHPDKIFVEWAWNEQNELDELYNLYLTGKDKYEAAINAKHAPNRRDAFLKNEIMQLAFRAGKKAKLTKIYAIDYKGTSFPYDSVMQAMQEANQEVLMKDIENYMKTYEASENKKIETYTLTQLLLDDNTEKELAANRGFYIQKLNRIGKTDNFAGPYLVSEWYRRNLYMHSIVQKAIEAKDSKIMILVGSGHAAIMKEFYEVDDRFKLVELKDVLKK